MNRQAKVLRSSGIAHFLVSFSVWQLMGQHVGILFLLSCLHNQQRSRDNKINVEDIVASESLAAAP